MDDARVSVVWDEGFTRYNFGTGHPMDPVRLDLTARLCHALGLFADAVVMVSPVEASTEALVRVHDPQYIAAVQRASIDPRAADPRFGLGTEDDPAFVGMHEVSARIADGSRLIAEQVWSGHMDHGVNFTGGLHHAMRDRAAGFCVYNDAVMAIDWLLQAGATRVAYVDVDAHHGDGVEGAFWDDPRVLTLSVHETGKILFPGTGFPREIGGVEALGCAVNLALPTQTRDAQWLRAIDATVPALLRAFRPQILVSQHGADTHYTDPLTHLAISVDAQRAVMTQLHDLAHELCEGRWVALGGGGYQPVSVVPRTWSHLVAIAAHRPVDVATAIPTSWLNHAYQISADLPETMGDGAYENGHVAFRSWEHGYDPGNSLDAAVMATREAVFSYHGLDAWYD
ncbi:acetoin utilization protein AcuC [Dermatophilus congolensis]|uniref:acetoin utilization protein AcuC n=1 Tax=Dermatophilus congolensis TaxID=1863 RepID=UPI0004099948|nr:acetoin utilization protein AcuC [Dermatophilus congolensis]